MNFCIGFSHHSYWCTFSGKFVEPYGNVLYTVLPCHNGNVSMDGVSTAHFKRTLRFRHCNRMSGGKFIRTSTEQRAYREFRNLTFAKFMRASSRESEALIQRKYHISQEFHQVTANYRNNESKVVVLCNAATAEQCARRVLIEMTQLELFYQELLSNFTGQ